ncbi:MAG: NAD-dependent epimerase/dehydratase family protein, partial [Pseudomonadota bacterium]
MRRRWREGGRDQARRGEGARYLRIMVEMSSFAPGFAAAVIGASGGIGAALADGLEAAGADVLRLSRADGLDLTDEARVAAAAERAGPRDLTICAAGLLHGEGIEPEKTWRAFDPA